MKLNCATAISTERLEREARRFVEEDPQQRRDDRLWGALHCVGEIAKLRALSGDPAGVEVCHDLGIEFTREDFLKMADCGALRSIKRAASGSLYADDAAQAVPSNAPLTKGSILDFDAVITTTRKDRDGDVLETSGANLDPNCPLLWQHIPTQPIGKVNAITKRTDKVLAARFSIFDTDLGRDAATLVEGGALRISHGFEPIEFEPLESKAGRWHIKKFQIVEVSLVSVPSNTDAVITAATRLKLRSPIAKEWLSSLVRSRT